MSERGSYVYFVQPEGGGPIKIGSSAVPFARLSALMTWSPYPLAIIAHAPGNPIAEGDLQFRYRRHRYHGEWFHPVPEIVALVDDVRRSGQIPSAFAGCNPLPTPHLPLVGRLLKVHDLRQDDLAKYCGVGDSSIHRVATIEIAPRHVAAIISFFADHGVTLSIDDLYVAGIGHKRRRKKRSEIALEAIAERAA